MAKEEKGLKKQSGKEYSIFISYRGSSEISKKFAQKLYQAIVNTPHYKDVFGEPFYSPANAFGNFKKDIDEVMRHVKYFIIPYFEGFYDDFLTSGGNPNKESITRLEMESALRQKGVYFVPVYLDGTKPKAGVIKQIFRQKATWISCANQSFELKPANDENAIDDLIDEICESLAWHQNNFHSQGLNIIEPNNIALSFKSDTEDSSRYPLYSRLFGCNRITFVNIAATAFISGSEIADAYIQSDWMKRWYIKKIKSGEIKTEIIIIDPDSPAGEDAAKYKCYPLGLNVDKQQIIKRNLEELLALKTIYQNTKIRIYLTDIAIPNGIMRVEYTESYANYMKIDTYMPLISDDKSRPSFYLLKKNQETTALYHFYEECIAKITDHASELKRKMLYLWITEQHFAHRAKYDRSVKEHTRTACQKCVSNHIPMEIDILFLTPENGEYCEEDIVIGRDEKVQIDHVAKRISECTKSEFEKMKTPETITLKELLEMIYSPLKETKEMTGVLIEIKQEFQEEQGRSGKERDDMCKKVDALYQLLSKYPRKIAIHSSNPYIVRYAREKSKNFGLNILCGQITLDMEKYDVSNTFKKMHETGECLKISNPDFISCNVEDIKKLYILTYCYRNGKPLLGWNVKAENAEINALCDSLILDDYDSDEWKNYKNQIAKNHTKEETNGKTG